MYVSHTNIYIYLNTEKYKIPKPKTHKIHKRLANVPGRPIASNCGTPNEKVSEYLSFLLKLVMQDGWSYTKDTRDFFKKIIRLAKTREGTILVKTNVVGVSPNICHDLGLQSLRKRLNETTICKVLIEEIISMAEFVLIITLNLMKNFASKDQEQLLELNLQILRLYFHGRNRNQFS